MSFRRKMNRHEAWASYCEEHNVLLEQIGLHPSVTRTESAFREFATSGTVDGVLVSPRAGELGDEDFWKLHTFIQSYFDMDSILFTDYEQSRLSR